MLILCLIIGDLLQFNGWAEIGACQPILFIRLSITATAPRYFSSRSLHRANMDGMIRRHKNRKERESEEGRSALA